MWVTGHFNPTLDSFLPFWYPNDVYKNLEIPSKHVLFIRACWFLAFREHFRMLGEKVHT